MTQSHVEKLQQQEFAKNAALIILLFGQDEEGDAAYVYLAVPLNKTEAFRKAYDSGEFELDDYGVVIEQGKGQPSEEVKQRMIDQYGFDHDSEYVFG